MPPSVSTGTLVDARGRRWRLVACVDHTDCRELHVHDGSGGRRVLLWPFDRPRPASIVPRVRVVSLARWARRTGRALARMTDPRTPRGLFSGDILPYQLAPAIAMASGTPRVLLADEVGLGKTIQAGWMLADLLAREPESRALIAVPASLREQWLSELQSFFSLSASRVDAGWLRSAVADRPADVSPWAAPGIYLGSIDFLKQPDVARALTDVTWDALIVDEAHAAAAPTERHAALARIAAVSRRVIVITATPYSGDSAGFASMMALGGLDGDEPPLTFRRSRDDAGDGRSRRHHFATVRVGRAEFRLQRLLERYTREVWRGAPGDVESARLAMTILRKRALSSPAAALRSLSRRLELLRGAAPAPRQLSLFDDPPEPDDALPEAALATPGLADAGLEARWLGALVDAAAAAAAGDSKQRFLLRLLRRLRGDSAIVFTEYRDTLRHLAERLPDALQLHGGLTGVERSDVQRRFNAGGGVLLATDAAADGLNLQRRCRVVVNYELPWNPARLEQRIGRVDRIGQTRTVHAVSLIARDTAEDLVVASLARRLARVAATLGDRDRLASFLTDARTARSVIAGGAIDFTLGEEATPAPPVRRPTADAYPVETIAAQVRSRAIAGETQGAIVVARMRAGLSAPGEIVVLRIAAVTERGVVAERPLILQLRDPMIRRPARQREAREIACRAGATAARAALAMDDVRAWLEAVVRTHRATVRARVVREESLRRGVAAAGELQPGLFDRRAIVDRERLAGTAQRRGREHDERLARLAEELEVRLECAVTAVLILWR